VIDVAKGADPVVPGGLKSHFVEKSTEAAMYFAMSRQADRKGYPEVAEAFKRYGMGESEHVSKKKQTKPKNGEKQERERLSGSRKASLFVTLAMASSSK
jgi:rubrerythrin